MNNRMRYYKLSTEITAHEFALGVQSAKLEQVIDNALNKVKTMDGLQALNDSDWYKNTKAQYLSLLKERIKYHEQQMSQLTPLKGNLTTLELGIETKLRKMLLSDYTKLLDSAKQNQL